MNRPESPCDKECEDRNVDYCFRCPKLKAYVEERARYYEYTLAEGQHKADWVRRFPRGFVEKAKEKNKRFK